MISLKQKLNQIAPDVFEGTPVLFAYLYGSYATGESHRFSDLDVGVSPSLAQRGDHFEGYCRHD
jgi:predicted nucleotidyltransferase